MGWWARDITRVKGDKWWRTVYIVGEEMDTMLDLMSVNIFKCRIIGYSGQ